MSGDGGACSRAEAVGERAAPEGGPGLNMKW
jgi:hypothetical protein